MIALSRLYRAILNHFGTILDLYLNFSETRFVSVYFVFLMSSGAFNKSQGFYKDYSLESKQDFGLMSGIQTKVQNLNTDQKWPLSIFYMTYHSRLWRNEESHQKWQIYPLKVIFLLTNHLNTLLPIFEYPIGILNNFVRRYETS